MKPLIAVKWDDAYGDATSVVSEDNIESSHKPFPVVTYGIPLKDDDIGILIVNEDVGNGEWRGKTFIPRSLIKETWIVAKNPRRKRVYDKNKNEPSQPNPHVGH